MTPHQRCLAAIACQPVDRAPTYVPAIACEVASAILGRRAYGGTGSLRYAEVEAWSRGPEAHAEWEMRMFEDVLALHRALECDVFHMPWRMNRRPAHRLDEHTFVFGDIEAEHSVWQYNPDSGEFSEIRRGGMGRSPEQALREQVAQMESGDGGAMARRTAIAELERLCRRRGSEFFVVGVGGGINVGTTEESLMATALAPELVARKCAIQADHAISTGELLARSAAPRVMLGGGDMAGNTGPLYSPAAFRRIVLPAYRRAIQRLNGLGVHYAFRSDGNLWSVADMLFDEAGCPGFGEADRDAGMSIAALRRRYPGLVIWGNLSSVFLRQRTAREVRDEAKRLLEESNGRGYFQACSNAIVKGTPPENVLALFSVRR